MNKEQKNPTIKKTEYQEAHGGNESFENITENPEEMRNQILAYSEKAVTDFENTSADALLEDETIAAKEGLKIDAADKGELQEEDLEAECERNNLFAEIDNENEAGHLKTKACPNCGKENRGTNKFCEECGRKFEQKDDENIENKKKEIIKLGQKKIHAMYREGKSGSKEYAALSGMLLKYENGQNVWKSPSEIDVAEVDGVLKKMEQEEIFNTGKERIMSLYSEGKNISPEYLSLYLAITKKVDGRHAWKNLDEVDLKYVKNILNNLDSGHVSVMKERSIENPELLSDKEASKKFLAEERVALAQKFWEQRRNQGSRLSRLRKLAEQAQEMMSGEQGDEKFGRICGLQSAEANIMAQRFRSEKLSNQDVADERENFSELINSSNTINLLKEELKEHYAKASIMAKERFNVLNRSLEHVIRRNNVFIVHKIEERESLRHNENSNVSKESTYEDDIDILISLEPSISASSVIPGEKANLWPGASGFILGGGQIGEVGTTDVGSISNGIKIRGGKESSIKKIDEVVGRQSNSARSDYERFGEHGMNEIIVNNPEIFGFFQHAEVDDEGKFWIYDLDTKYYAQKAEQEKEDGYYKSVDSYFNVLQNNISGFRSRFNVAAQRGVPLYVMIGDRNLYEFICVRDDGSIEVGSKLSPEDVATGKAGLIVEKRREIGERILQKKLFKKEKTTQEAREIIDSL